MPEDAPPHKLLGGGVALQRPLVKIVPVSVMPHEFAEEVHDSPKLAGNPPPPLPPPLPPPGQLAFDGGVALQRPLHKIVPVLVCPHPFGNERHASPYPDGFEGTEAEHEPSHWMAPEFDCPHAFVPDEQAVPVFPAQHSPGVCSFDGHDAGMGIPVLLPVTREKVIPRTSLEGAGNNESPPRRDAPKKTKTTSKRKENCFLYGVSCVSIYDYCTTA